MEVLELQEVNYQSLRGTIKNLANFVCSNAGKIYN